MKKLLSLTLCSLSLSAFAGPINPMDFYTPDNIDQRTVEYIWRNQTTEVDGKDCYKRAQLWTTAMRDLRGRQVKVNKIFIHYTDKFNDLLDDLTVDGEQHRVSKFNIFGKLSNPSKKYGITSREADLMRNNIVWDYHVAPMAIVNGQEVVLDKTLPLPYDVEMPYNKNASFSLKTRMSTPEEWLEALTVRGEMLWSIRKKIIEHEMNETREDMRSSNERKREKAIAKLPRLQSEYRALDMDIEDSIDIKCEKIESMAELDANHNNAWCFYSVVPMYYYNEIDLRNLAYGNTGLNHAMAVPTSYATETNFSKGRNYIQNSFSHDELKNALGELKGNREDPIRQYYEQILEAL